MTIFTGESGRLFRVASEFDMSAYTELSIMFYKPDGTYVTKTTANGIVLGTVDVVDEDLGELPANHYVEYSIEVGLITATDYGDWATQLLYTNTSAAVPDNLYGELVKFTVKERKNKWLA